MLKVSQWLAKWLLTAALVSMISVLVTWTTVSLYADKLMQQFSLGSAVQKPQFSDLLSNLSLPSNRVRTVGKASPDASASASPSPAPAAADSPVSAQANANADAAAAGGAASASAPPSGSAAAATPTPPVDALPVMGQASGAEQKQLVMSADQFYKLKENMSDEDKMKVFTILAGSVPEDQLQQISSYIENGITQAELTQIETIIQKDVKPDDYNQLVAILNKYQ